jgi:hypothetical protein
VTGPARGTPPSTHRRSPVDNGVTSIFVLAEGARERGFPAWDPDDETARRIASAVADEWVAHLRMAIADHLDGAAHDTATEQYQQLEDELSAGNKLGWAEECEMCTVQTSQLALRLPLTGNINLPSADWAVFR